MAAEADDTAEVWRLERRLWLEGRAAYDELLDPDCLMVFAGLGVMRGAAIGQSLEGAPRWERAAFAETVAARPADGLVVLGYRAEAARAGEGYRAWCSSTWRRAGAGWRMVQHQQTPEP